MKKIFKTIATALVLTAAANTFAANTTTMQQTMDPQERAKIEEVVHQYLLRKPEVIVEVMQILQRKQYDEAEAVMKQTQKTATKYADALFHQSNDPSTGNPDGKVTVVEFFDYQCPHCVDMAPVIADFVKTNPNIRVVFKDFPIRGPMSEVAARAAIAANMQGKYYEFNHALLTTNQPLTEDNIYKIAKNTGLDVEKLKKDMNDATVDKQLKANMKLAQDLQLFGTPAFFIAKSDVGNNKGMITYIPGQMNKQQMQTEIDKIVK